MPDVFTRKKRSAVMAAIRSSGNRGTELKLIAIFREAGIRGWRRNFPLEGKPDFCFPKIRMAVFVDGCFWHGCPRHGRKPASNTEYWHAKLERNKKRDLAVGRLLRKKRWRVIRIWEHQLSSPARFIKTIDRALKQGLTAHQERIR
jgi:DNA mismatch endonuclease (patch repair protein)